MGGPASSYATASIAIRIVWQHKSHHCGKVDIPSGWSGALHFCKWMVQYLHVMWPSLSVSFPKTRIKIFLQTHSILITAWDWLASLAYGDAVFVYSCVFSFFLYLFYVLLTFTSVPCNYACCLCGVFIYFQFSLLLFYSYLSVWFCLFFLALSIVYFSINFHLVLCVFKSVSVICSVCKFVQCLSTHLFSNTFWLIKTHIV